MKKLQNIIQKIKNIPKERYIALLVLLIFAVTVSIPTLARYKYRLDLEEILIKNEVWDGTVATSLKGEGTELNPYLITNASELAYFQQQLKETTFENMYFKLENDILINKGTFNFDSNQITYTLDNKTMYMENYSNNLYDTSELNSTPLPTVNSFEPLNNFAGHFDGDHYRIYGLFMTSEEEQLALFTNLEGTVENLYIENAMVYGGSSTAILASNTNNATIKNVYTEGNVIGTLTKTENTRISLLEDYSNSKTIEAFNDEIELPNIYLENIKSIILKGTYSSDENTQLLINQNAIVPGEFEIELGTELLNKLTLEINDETERNFSLTNMTYEITYEIGVTSSIVAKANNTTIKNVINKADIYAIDNAAGLLGITQNTSIKNSYNIGEINAVNNASGLIDIVENSEEDIIINNLYNTGSMNARYTYPFVKGVYDNKSLELKNIFSTVETNSNTDKNQEITYTNVYDVKEYEDTEITKYTLETIYEELNFKETLEYKEFVDNTVLEINEDAVWVYENSYLPIIYIDDLNDPIATLRVGTYKWEDNRYELEEIYLSSNTAFMITPKDSEEQITAYYYIHKGKTSLTKSQLVNANWNEYTNLVTLNEEGYYVIYAKVIDQDGNIKYLNSEVMVVDLNAPAGVITMNDYHWTVYNENLITYNIADTTEITLRAEDAYSEVTEIKYYISNTVIDKTALDNLEESNWIDYEDKIIIDKKGTYIVYLKTKDSLNHSAYYNTDYIIFGGFEEKVTVNDGQVPEYDRINITNTSSVTYNFEYSQDITYQDGYITYLVSTNPLPIGSKITLKNKTTNEVYKYYVTEEKNRYRLKDFVKIGQTNENNKFNDENFIKGQNKNLSFTIDFTKAEFVSDVEFNTYIDICDNQNKVVLSTLRSTFKNTKVYYDAKSYMTLSKVNETEEIELNSDSITDIELVADLLIENLPEVPIYHTEYFDKKMGITIKLVDLENNIVDKKYLKNIAFKIDDETYSPDNDGIVRIKFADEVLRINKTLKIVTYATDSKLETGNYNFIITPYVSSDGKYTLTYSNKSITIPATTTKKEKVEYGFKVDMDNQDKVLYKENNVATMNFKINEISNFNASNVRVSLYRKKSLSGYDQVYDLVDLNDYAVDGLQQAETYVYYVTTDNFDLKLNTTLFEKRGYELRFDLYDGDKYITTIKKKFIVR